MQASKQADFVRWFRAAAPYVHAFGGRTFVIAFGGEVVMDGSFVAIIESAESLVSKTTKVKNQKETIILIGPEGDFTDGEKGLMMNKGIQSITLSENILRVETAGLVAVTQWNALKDLNAI